MHPPSLSHIHICEYHHTGSSNWSYLPSSTRWSDLVASINESDGSLEEMPGYVVPRTYGGRSLPGLPGDSAKRCFVAVYAPHHEQGYTLLDKLATELSEEKELFLIRTRVNKPGFTKNESKEFFTNHPGQIDLSFAGPMIGMEFAGTDDMYAVIKQAAAELPSVFVSPANEAGAMLAKYFETIKAF